MNCSKCGVETGPAFGMCSACIQLEDSPTVVSIDKVVPLKDSAHHFIKRMVKTLQKQGQIEPLQVHEYEGNFLVFHDDPHGNEIVYAARILGWPTLLVLVTNHYRP